MQHLQNIAVRAQQRYLSYHFYDKYEEMKHHIDSGNYHYDETCLIKRKVFFVWNLDFYKTKFKGMKKTVILKSTEEVEFIINKLRRYY